MLDDFTPEMQTELWNQLRADCLRSVELINQLQPAGGYRAMTHNDLEQLAYISEQTRLKLRILGAPRMY